MQKQLTYLIVFILLGLSTLWITAEPTYNVDDFAKILQEEYQSQIKKNQSTKKIPRKRTRPTPPSVTPHTKRHTPHRPQVANKTPPQHPANSNKAPEPQSLFNAASSGNNKIIAQLLQQGLNINSVNKERETALHMAAAHGHYSTVIYLLNHGANLHSRTIKNWVPLHHATRFRHADIANYLKQRGSSPYTRTSDGLSAIDMAKNNNDKRLIHVLGGR